jgi:hypothetical protein
MTEAKNLFNLPPDLFDLVCEKIQDPEDPVLVLMSTYPLG